jgi:predicted PurR-regulated permease PerM
MNITRKWTYALLTLVLVIIAWYFKVIIGYVVIAGVLSLIGQPLMEMLGRLELRGHRLPSSIMAALTILSLLSLFLGLTALFIPMVASESRRLSSIPQEDIVAGLQAPIEGLQLVVDRYSMSGSPVDVEQVLREQIVLHFNVDALTRGLNYAVGVTGELFIGFFAVCFITFFFLKDRQLLRSTIMLFVPVEHEERFGRVLSKSKGLLTRYFIGILIEMAIMMTVISIGMSALGVRNALLIGFLGGLLNIIPYLGPMIGAALGMLIGILTNSQGLMMPDLLTLMGKMALVYVLAQLLDNIVLQPLIYSKSVKAHPLEIFLVIIMAGSLAGIVGMIVAIPAYSIFRVFAGEFLAQFKMFSRLGEGV